MSAAPVQPAERQDIHKSCRTIETLLSVLNDYCEAAVAFASIQKRLSKALRDVAGLKANAQFAANAFGASSNILEVLADVDAKFAKIAEKESHNVTVEAKKWFKRLAKVEKAHDERMNESNARIKQAGQAYEKKFKKGAKDAGEEHARYINLLSIVGPEMSQEKYNHAVNVTQQNASVTFSVAASLSRIADAEWTRTCECMRRISPTIGSLGEWRSLCESAWTGSLPADLPVLSPESLPTPPHVSEWGQTGLSTSARRSLPVPPVSGPGLGFVSPPVAALLDPPHSPFTTASQNQGSVNSITTLSAFPFPPTHFPIPLAMNEADLQRQQIQIQSLQAVHSHAGSPDPLQSQVVLAPSAPVLMESPKHVAVTDLPESVPLDSRSSHSPQTSQIPSPSNQFTCAVGTLSGSEPSILSPEDKGAIPIGVPKKPRRPSLITRVPPPSDKSFGPVSPFKRAEYPSADKEFGVHSDSSKGVFRSHSVDVAKKNIERADSTRSAGSNVAALRSKYIRVVEPPSQVPKDIPRLPFSVSDIVSRYQPIDEPMSPRQTTSPVVDRFPPDTSVSVAARDLPIKENEIWRRKQRIEELAELELKEKEYELRQRERHLNQRARDLERDRLQFLSSRPEPAAAEGPKGPRSSVFQHKRGSQSVTHINAPSTTTTTSSSGISPRPTTPQSQSQFQSRSPARSLVLPPKDHAPFCGCDTCSVSKYKASDTIPSPRDLRPPEPPILLRPEKPKGWIRRLSMPSVNLAFSLDAKKNASALSLKAGLSLPSENGRLRKRSFEQQTSRTVFGR